MDYTRSRFIMGLAFLAFFIGPANTPADARLSNSFTSAQPLSHVTGTGASIQVNTIFVGHGYNSDEHVGHENDQLNPHEPGLPITIENNTNVPMGGVQFDLDFMPDGNFGSPWRLTDHNGDEGVSHVDSVVSLLSPEWTVNTYEQPDGTLRVVLYNTVGATIDPGTTDILQLYFRTDAMTVGQAENSPLGETNPVSVVDGSVNVSSGHGVEIGSGWSEGKIQTGLLHDTNLDGLRNVQDVVVWVRTWLDEMSSPVPPPSAPAGPYPHYTNWHVNPDNVRFRIFDSNLDQQLNVSDVVGIVMVILGETDSHPYPYPTGNRINWNSGSPPVKSVADGVPTVVDLGTPAVQLGGQLAIPVLLNAGAMITGGEMVFSFDPEVMTVGEPYLEHKASNFILQSKVENGLVRLMVISLSKNEGLATGNKPALMIPITLMDDREGMLTLDSALLVNQFAQQLPVRLGEYTQAVDKAMMAPTAFALRNNAPNPFNPTTTISYEVPKQAHIQLVIYNILGQEVIRLVDEVKSAGRYTVVWDARNALGRAVGSGIYMYRMSSSSGFNDVKRMTLLK